MMATVVNRNMLPAIQKRGTTISGALLVLLTFYIIAFPKGGIKAGGVPLTFGYAFTLVMLIVCMLRNKTLSLPIDRVLAFLPCGLLALWSAFVIIINGTENTGFTISYFISVLYLPIFGLICFSSSSLDFYYNGIERAFVWAVRFIVVYGIFLFLFKQFTGKWIEIPYITVNIADVGQLDDKYINRGGIFKLISTYNNGNIFGVSLAIMAPLYMRLENKIFMGWVMYAAMFLTLSRTAWIAAILITFLRTMSKGVRPLALLYLTIGLLIAGAVIIGLLSFLGLDMAFVFDSNLGGRASQLNVFDDVRIIPAEQVSPLPEIVYLGMLRYFGIPGFILFVAHLLTPSLLLWGQGVRVLSVSRASACLQGLLIYAVVAGADAAFSFIPVMMIFWLVAGMGFWYVHRQAWLVKDAREAPR